MTIVETVRKDVRTRLEQIRASLHGTPVAGEVTFGQQGTEQAGQPAAPQTQPQQGQPQPGQG